MAEALEYENEFEPDLEEEERQRILVALADNLIVRRARAIRYRAQLGIEEQWVEDEEYYAGIDDANRHEFASWRPRKGRTVDTVDESPASRNDGSTIFPNITRPFVDASAARMADMLLPTDDRSFAIEPTPVPELIALADKGQIPPSIEEQLRQAFLGDDEDAIPSEEALAALEAARSQLIEKSKRLRSMAKESADRAQAQIDDWLTECSYHGEVREVLHDLMKLGVGVLKGPFATQVKRVAWVNGDIRIDNAVNPASRRVDVWNCFPAAGCGEDIQSGDCHFERDYIGRRALARLIGQDGYIDDAIRRALAQGPTVATATVDATKREDLGDFGLVGTDTDGQFEIWYCYATVSHAELAACEIECGEQIETAQDRPSKDYYDVELTLVNTQVIKASINLVTDGSYPYDYMVYQRIPGTPYGAGVSRHVRTAQRMLKAAARCLMDNAGLAGGPMWWYHPGYLSPLDRQLGIAPRKGWVVTKPDAELRDLDKAIGYVDMPDNIASLTGIIELAMRFAQETTGLPMILQGQQGDATRTLGGMQMLHNNASTVMRRLARTYDDSIQVPHMQRYYQWLLAYGQDNRAKGEFIVNARGSSTLVEREIQQQGLMQMGQLVANPQFGIDPRRWAESLVKSQRLSWDDLRYQDPEWQKVVEALAQSAQAGDTRVEVAQIQAQSRLQLLEKEQEFDQAMAALDYEREQMERETTIAMRALEREDTEADRSASAQAQLNDIKAQLTALTMRLNTQKELSREARNRRSVAALSPPLEPAGRAPDGQAWAA